MSEQGIVGPALSECEAKIDGQWFAVSPGKAVGRLVAAEKRCPVCRGRVSIFSTFSVKDRRWLAHQLKHDGCPLLPEIYCGTPSPHPNAVE